MGTEAPRRLTKAQAIAIRRAELGKCKAMLADKKEPRQCTNWAVDEKGYCGQHYAIEIEKTLKTTREAARKAEMIEKIDAYLARTGQKPHSCEESRCYWAEHRRRIPDGVLARSS